MAGRASNTDCYNMSHKRRGEAVIINIENFEPSVTRDRRIGSKRDASRMKDVLEEMGFSVQPFQDLTAQQMRDELRKVAREDHSDADCFACVIMTHGEENSVYGKDNLIEIDTLIDPYKGCRTLAGKPKLFFIQACRGKKEDLGVKVRFDAVPSPPGPEDFEETDADSIMYSKISSEADFLVAYSVVKGFPAVRHLEEGTWFIQTLADVLQENWKHQDILTMMTTVCRKVAYDCETCKGRKQAPCITSTLTRVLYFGSWWRYGFRSYILAPVIPTLAFLSFVIIRQATKK